MTNSNSVGRTAVLAICFALVGFSYALATGNADVATVAEVAPSVTIGSNPPLNFANPFVSGPGSDRDLGDAIAGSALTRMIRAKGGVAPYSFVQGVPVPPPNLNLLLNGLLTGVLDSFFTPAGTNPNPVRFAVTVSDSLGFGGVHSKTEMFRLTVVADKTFRFANSVLSDGIQLSPYSDVVPVLNGNSPIAITASAVTLNGVPTQFNLLEDVGLSMSYDGTVYGSPTVSGTIAFLAKAKDKNGAQARSRDGISVGQVFTLNVLANKIVRTLISATSITINAGFGTSNKLGSVSYKGIVNLGNATLASLSGLPFVMHIGTYSAPVASFDMHGFASTPKRVFPGIQANVNKSGTVSVNVKNDTINLDPIIISGGTVKLAVELHLGGAVISSEFLRFTVKSNQNALTLIYKADSDHAPSGAFQITKVTGTDDKALSGDSWKVSYFNIAPQGTAISAITQVEVAIGNNFDKITMPVKNSKNKITGKSSSKTPAVVTAFSADLFKGKGSYTTNLLPTTLTGIPAVHKGGTGSYATAISYLDANKAIVTGGQSAVPVFGTKSWSNTH